jgi:acyl-CoA synthetase (AMP-forming)/AMP-acid ligase II
MARRGRYRQAVSVIRTTGLANLCDLYLRSTQWRGSEELFVDAQDRLSGNAALDASLRLASAYARLGAQPGDVVAFMCRPSARHAAAWFAATLSGRIACNLHIRDAAPSIGRVLKWLAPKIVVFDPDLTDLAGEAVAASGLELACLSLGNDSPDTASYSAALAQEARWDPAANPIDSAAIAAILLSSGTTGDPKGVAHSHRSLLEGVKGGHQIFGGMSMHDTVLICMQPSFAAWSVVTLPMVGAKGRVVYGGQFNARNLLATCERERITLVPLVPTMWRMVFAEDHGSYDLSRLRCVTMSGEPPVQSDVETLRAHFCENISCSYLSSEVFTAGGVTALTPDLVERGKLGSSGRPALGVDVKIINPEGSFDDELPQGEIGEIAVSAPSLAAGYWHNEALSRKQFHEGWWRSGDLGHIDADGYLWVSGRTDNIINTGGIKVGGEEIEAALLRHPGIHQCAVIGQPDARFGQRIEAYCVAASGDITPAELDRFLRESCNLAGFKVPKVFHFLDQLPTGPTGKLLRRALRRLL